MSVWYPELYRESTGMKAFLSACVATAVIWVSMTAWTYIELRRHQPSAHPVDGQITSFPPEAAIIQGLVSLPLMFIVMLVISGCAFGVAAVIRRVRAARKEKA